LVKLIVNECLTLPQEQLAERASRLYDQLSYPQIGIIASQHYTASRNPTGSLKQLKRTLKRFPHHAETQFHLGRLYVANDKIIRAIQSFQRCLEQESSNADAHFELAQIHHDLKNEKLAVEHYLLAYVYGREGAFRRKVAFALAVLLEASGESHTQYAVILSLVLKLEQEAVKTAATFSHLARVCNQHNLMTAALACSRLAVQASPDNTQCQVNLGYSCWIAGLPNEAIYHYQQALALDEANTFALNNLGALYLDELNDYTSASQLFKQAIELNPSYALAYYNLGRAYSHQQLSTQAAMAFVKARELNEVTQELDSEDINQRMHELYEQL
jgi:superkiller protein 3